jgi:hypothetical protein
VLCVTHRGPRADTRPGFGYDADVNLLLIVLILAGLFALPFTMARLEDGARKAPTHRAPSRRTSSSRSTVSR